MRAIRTRYFPPGNLRGTRIVADAGEHNCRATIKIDPEWDFQNDSEQAHFQAVLALCRKLNWKGQYCVGGHKNAYYWVPMDINWTVKP